MQVILDIKYMVRDCIIENDVDTAVLVFLACQDIGPMAHKPVIRQPIKLFHKPISLIV
jgi:hypothetical protein